MTTSNLQKLSSLRASQLSLVGAKAAVLGELAFAGLPVPDGEVITTHAVAAWLRDQQWPAEIMAFLAAQEAPLAVRSSSVAEEGSQFSGVFESVLYVSGRDTLLAALARVVQSAHSERAQEAYRAAGLDPEKAPGFAVLLQPMQPALLSGVLLSRDFAHPEQLRLEITQGTGEALVSGQVRPATLRIHRETREVIIDQRPEIAQLFVQDPTYKDLLVRYALQIESILGGAAVELEWVLTEKTASQPIQILQARRQPKLDEDRSLFLWDRGHNPMPLSEAQTAAARALDQRGKIPFRLKVTDGYLFVAPRPNATIVRPKLSPDFVDFFEGEICAKILGPVLEAPKDLADAFRRYVLFCEEYFSGVLSGPRQVLDELRVFLSERGVLHGGANCPAQLPPTDPVAALMAGTRTKNFRKDAVLYTLALATKQSQEAHRAVQTFATPLPTQTWTDPEAKRVVQIWRDFLAMYGEESFGWDVCYKTFLEDPTPLLETIEAFRNSAVPPPEVRRRSASREAANIARMLSEALAPEDRPVFSDKLSYARLLFPLMEEDDLLFSKAQAYLRRALLEAGIRAGLTDLTDVFWVDPQLLITKQPVERIHEQATRNRVVSQSRAARPPQPPLVRDGDTLRGEGASGGVATGKVRILRDLSQARLTPGEILVVPALVPMVSHLLFFAAGIVAEQGGTLSHAASMAREYSVPAVVGVPGATQLLRDGETVSIDGLRGLIQRLS
jgi:phosphoenolpyruvate synthase/pyruvate phosphate dikinase